MGTVIGAATRRRPTTIQARRSLVHDAAAVIRAEYPSDLRLDAVARRIATSPRSLQRAFLEDAGMPFSEYLCRVRMDAAARLLHGTTMTVRQIAGRVGYRQQAQFAKAFRRHTGMGPMEYRMKSGLTAG